MVDSVWLGGGSVVIGEQGPLGGDPQLPVEPDPSGQGEEPLTDADNDPAQRATTMAFQSKLVLEGVDDRLDPLAHPTQRPEPARLVAAVRADQPGTQPSDVAFELGTGQALVGQDDGAHRQRLPAGGVIQQHLGDLALAEGGDGQAPGDGHAVWGTQQVQLEAPVPSAQDGETMARWPMARRR